ncbi:crotonyl-CoA carboxylase/reductase [Saccharomonospora sp. NPDC006951]
MDSLQELAYGNASSKGADIPLPAHYQAAYLQREDVEKFANREEKDVRQTMRVGRVSMPDLAPDEVAVAVMASSINYNTVWSALFEPVPTFSFLERLGKKGKWESRHDLPYQVVGSDAAGVIVKLGSGVRRWKTGDHVVVSPAYVDDQEPGTHADGMMGSSQLAWGFETNFGGLAHFAVVRASQLIPKPAHLSWEEAACNTLCAGTAYRMLIGEHGARIKQGDIVLIWGATGGLGGYAVQFVKNGGGIPVGVVGSERKASLLKRLGCDVVINREEFGLGEDISRDSKLSAAKKLGRVIRREAGGDPHFVFDYVGRSTFDISVFLCRRGGAVVTCGSSSGYEHRYDNRYLWMNLKRIIGSHVANLQEQWEANRLFELGKIIPMLSSVYPLSEVAEATRMVQTNNHVGKVGVLCLAPQEGLGVTDPAARARFDDSRIRTVRGV